MKRLLILATVLIVTTSLLAQTKPAPDTTKKEPFYTLSGSIKDFKLLYTAIAKPDDVTKNQVKGLLLWLQLIRPTVDSAEATKLKPPVEKKAPYK